METERIVYGLSKLNGTVFMVFGFWRLKTHFREAVFNGFGLSYRRSSFRH